MEKEKKVPFHLGQSIQKDIIHLFQRFYASFPPESRILQQFSYINFLELWKELKYSNIFIFSSKCKKIQSWNFFQVYYYELFSLFCKDDIWNSELLQVQHQTLRKFLLHLFIFYYVYTIYILQPIRDRSIRINNLYISLFHSHLQYFKQLSRILVNENGSSVSFLQDVIQILEFLLANQPFIISQGGCGLISYSLLSKQASFLADHSKQIGSWNEETETLITGLLEEISQPSCSNIFHQFIESLSSLGIRVRNEPLMEIQTSEPPLSEESRDIPELDQRTTDDKREILQKRREEYYNKLAQRRQRQEQRVMRTLQRLQQMKDRIYSRMTKVSKDANNKSSLFKRKSSTNQSNTEVGFPHPTAPSQVEGILEDLTTMIDNFSSLPAFQNNPANSKGKTSLSTKYGRPSQARPPVEETITFLEDDDAAPDEFFDFIQQPPTNPSPLTSSQRSKASDREASNDELSKAEMLLNELTAAIDSVLLPNSNEVNSNHILQRKSKANTSSSDGEREDFEKESEPNQVENETSAISSNELNQIESLVNNLNSLVGSILGNDGDFSNNPATNLTAASKRSRKKSQSEAPKATGKRKQTSSSANVEEQQQSTPSTETQPAKKSRRQKSKPSQVLEPVRVPATEPPGSASEDVLALLSDLEMTTQSILSQAP